MSERHRDSKYMKTTQPPLFVCHPRYTDDLQNSINTALKELWGFYCFNKNKMDYLIGNDNLKDIVWDFLQPWVENKVFDGQRETYQQVVERYDRYFTQTHGETIFYIDDTLEGRRHEEVFDIMRADLDTKLALIGQSIIQWYDRTARWNAHQK